jgi:hypothetical protein
VAKDNTHPKKDSKNAALNISPTCRSYFTTPSSENFQFYNRSCEHLHFASLFLALATRQGNGRKAYLCSPNIVQGWVGKCRRGVGNKTTGSPKLLLQHRAHKAIRLEQTEQRVLQECFRSAQRWLTSISEGLRHMSGMGARFALLWRRHAFVLGVLATGAKTCLADILVQTQMEGKKRREIDWRRNLTFSSFGIFYLGIFQERTD